MTHFCWPTQSKICLAFDWSTQIKIPRTAPAYSTKYTEDTEALGRQQLSQARSKPDKVLQKHRYVKVKRYRRRIATSDNNPVYCTVTIVPISESDPTRKSTWAYFVLYRQETRRTATFIGFRNGKFYVYNSQQVCHCHVSITMFTVHVYFEIVDFIFHTQWITTNSKSLTINDSLNDELISN